ncbi:MAG: tetratricopeptide repeat protein [Bacteroidaceae bacterium]|nr:tetratricopeptide repeat protein [Bacteroidaceae bacterium]
MKRIALLLIFALSHALTSYSNVDSLKVVADSAYAKEDFDSAARTYQRIAKLGESSDVCYNLGNCYYRKDDMARAILWYERALLLSPGDDDVRFNLDMARSKTIDRVTPRHEFFFVSWCRSLTNLMSADGWGHLSVLLFVLCLISLALYIYGQQMWLRKSAFTLAVLLLLATLLSAACGWAQASRQARRSGAIVMSPAAVVKSTPAHSGSDLFVLHEGTRVEIRDNSLSDWVEVTLADGKQGWMERKQIEVI